MIDVELRFVKSFKCFLGTILNSLIRLSEAVVVVMSLNYASALSPYTNKGKCGLPEKFDSDDTLEGKIPLNLENSLNARAKTSCLIKFEAKCQEFAKLIDQSNYIVAITGAGLSTSCGIPDFRGNMNYLTKLCILVIDWNRLKFIWWNLVLKGPNGVWTLEKEGKLPEVNVSFEHAKPSFTHYALVEMAKISNLQEIQK